MRKTIVYPLLLIGSLLMTGHVRAQQPQWPDENARKLSIALYAIENLYVDEPNKKKLVEDAIRGMLDKLDPHSAYSDAEETKDLNEPLQGGFDGIGIQFNMLTDTLYVVQVISGGPSERVGLAAGDRIIMVDDTVIAGVKMKTTDVMRRLRGPKGTEVRVKVQRGGSPKLIEFKIIRGKIPVHSLDAAYMADSTTGYIRLNRFANTSHEEFLEALTRLRKEGMKHLVLDLQGNGGGYLHVACNLADEFLSNGRLIVYTEGRNSPREEATATATGNFEDGRLVILVDESSASASEIVSGAVQDWDRGVIVGRRTFGKGLVQRPIPLPDNSMIRLTIARYYTPGGRNIQKPYTGGDAAAYNRDLIDRYNHGELMNADSIHFPDSLRSRTLVNHRTVYGGGGIMPDRFIPLDTSRYTDYHRRLVGLGYIYRTVLSYVDGHRKALRKRYPDFNSFSQQFTVSDELLSDLCARATADSVAFDSAQYAKSRPLIALQLKALIARDLFDETAYYRIINEDNESLREALRIINNAEAYEKILRGVKSDK